MEFYSLCAGLIEDILSNRSWEILKSGEKMADLYPDMGFHFFCSFRSDFSSFF